MILYEILRLIKRFWIRRSSQSLINFYRKKGCKIGNNTIIFDPRNFELDYSRPSLVEIGDNVFLHRGVNILSHDYTSWVFVNLYDEFLPSLGRVKIGNNVWFGYNCTVLKGVTIGNNCIIGLGSIVSKDIPDNSVASGVPARVICSIEEYFSSRQEKYAEEALDFARSIKERFKREPTISDFKDEYPAFVDGGNIDSYPMMPYSNILKGENFERWKESHKAPFNGFVDFIKTVNFEK